MKAARIFAVIIAVLAVFWVLSGMFGSSDESVSASNTPSLKKQEQKTTVRAEDSVAISYHNIIKVTGRTQGYKETQIRAETSGQISALYMEEGQNVEKGQVIARIETSDRGARVEEARQRLNQAQIEYDAGKALYDRGFNTKIRLSQAQASLEAAQAALKAARVEQERTTIAAPFSGVISMQNIEQGDYVQAGTALFSVVALTPLEIEAYVSEHDIFSIKEGARVQAKTLSGEAVSGVVTFISPVANSATKTFRILIHVANEDRKLKSGLTVSVDIPGESVKAHHISPSILTLNNEGQVGVKILNVDNTVKFMPVRILKDEADGMWITGLAEQARIITVGQEFVIEGQAVEAALEESKSQKLEMPTEDTSVTDTETSLDMPTQNSDEAESSLITDSFLPSILGEDE